LFPSLRCFCFASLFFFRLISLNFLFVSLMKSTVLIQREWSETSPSVWLRSEKNFTSVSHSFASNRKQTAHPNAM
jgi:hypothetical protein